MHTRPNSLLRLYSILYVLTGTSHAPFLSQITHRLPKPKSAKEFLAMCARDINCLADESIRVRLKAAQRLQQVLFSKEKTLSDNDVIVSTSTQ